MPNTPNTEQECECHSCKMEGKQITVVDTPTPPEPSGIEALIEEGAQMFGSELIHLDCVCGAGNPKDCKECPEMARRTPNAVRPQVKDFIAKAHTLGKQERDREIGEKLDEIEGRADPAWGKSVMTVWTHAIQDLRKDITQQDNA